MPVYTETLTDFETTICIDVPQFCYDAVPAEFSVEDGCLYLTHAIIDDKKLLKDAVVDMIGPSEVRDIENYAEEQFYEAHPSGTQQIWDDE